MARVEATFPGGYRTKCIVQGTEKSFEFNTDYSKAYGGKGEFPTPWDTFLASFMACQGIHVRNYCAENGISTDDLKLQLDIVTAEDNREVIEFKVNIIFPHDFPEEMKEGALYEARHCKVIQHLLDFSPKVTYTTN